MTSGEPSPPLTVIWSPRARSELRAIDRQIAMQILECIGRYLATRAGDVKKLRPPETGLRLRCGDYRVFFELHTSGTIRITSVRDRREAYR